VLVSNWGFIVNPHFHPCHVDQNSFVEAELSEAPWHVPSTGAGPPGLPREGAHGEGSAVPATEEKPLLGNWGMLCSLFLLLQSTERTGLIENLEGQKRIFLQNW